MVSSSLVAAAAAAAVVCCTPRRFPQVGSLQAQLAAGSSSQQQQLAELQQQLQAAQAREAEARWVGGTKLLLLAGRQLFEHMCTWILGDTGTDCWLFGGELCKDKAQRTLYTFNSPPYGECVCWWVGHFGRLPFCSHSKGPRRWAAVVAASSYAAVQCHVTPRSTRPERFATKAQP